MLNVSQSFAKPASLLSAGTSSTPARCIGWLAIIPTGLPSMRAKPVISERP